MLTFSKANEKNSISFESRAKGFNDESIQNEKNIYVCLLNDGITNIFNWLFDALLIAKLVLFIYRAFQL